MSSEKNEGLADSGSGSGPSPEGSRRSSEKDGGLTGRPSGTDPFQPSLDKGEGPGGPGPGAEGARATSQRSEGHKPAEEPRDLTPEGRRLTAAPAERRYTEEQFAILLRLASEPETEARFPPAPPQEGLTLAEIVEIATEVGLDPARVRWAAALLHLREEPAPLMRLLGGRPKDRLEYVVGGRVPSDQLKRVVDVARKELAVQGESREVLGALEWKASAGSTEVAVAVAPREEETALQVASDRTGAMFSTYAGVGLPVGVALTVGTGMLFFGESGVGLLAAAVSGFTPAALLARALWRRSTARWRGRFARLVEALAREAESAAEASAEDGPRAELPSASEEGHGAGEVDRKA